MRVFMAKPTGYPRWTNFTQEEARSYAETSPHIIFMLAEENGMTDYDENYNLVDKIIEFETEGLPDDETAELFAFLIRSGHLAGLQGTYHRIARDLIEAGVITPDGEVVQER